MTALAIRDVSRRSGLSKPKRRDLLRRAERVEAEMETLCIHLDCRRAKAALWNAREHADVGAEAEADPQVQTVLPRLEEVVLG
jgi:MerR family transcriptional regulator, copper efflux regulator